MRWGYAESVLWRCGGKPVKTTTGTRGIKTGKEKVTVRLGEPTTTATDEPQRNESYLRNERNNETNATHEILAT